MKPLRLLGLPLHPMLVHFPVAAWTVATGLALLAVLEPHGNLPALARHANAFGLVTGAVAMLAGLAELTALPSEARLREAIGRHLALATCTWLCYGVMWTLQVKHMLALAAGTGLVAFVLLVIAGHAGASVVYHHGFPPRTGMQ